MSALFTASTTGLRDRRSMSAISASIAVTPPFTSVIITITSASSMARVACSRTSSINSADPTARGSTFFLFLRIFSRPMSSPPVSTRVNSVSIQDASAYRRSLVVPGMSSTIASRSPTTRLNRVDFPTFGLPTIATIGFLLFLLPIAPRRLLGFRRRNRGSDRGSG